MEFKFDGLDEALVLPDQYLKVRQFQRLEKALRVHDHLKKEDYFDYMRLCISDAFESREFIEKTDELDMTPHNSEEWEKLEAHLVLLYSAKNKIEDDDTKEVADIPLDKSETETPSPIENPAPSENPASTD